VIDKFAYLHKNANMRTSIDFPDPLFRSLKASAAMQGTSLRDHVLQLIERGMRAPEVAQPAKEAKVYQVPAIPTLNFGEGASFPPEFTTNRGINEFLDREEFEKYLNVVKYGRGSGPLASDSLDGSDAKP
jgi:hypothetical protein